MHYILQGHSSCRVRAHTRRHMLHESTRTGHSSCRVRAHSRRHMLHESTRRKMQHAIPTNKKWRLNQSHATTHTCYNATACKEVGACQGAVLQVMQSIMVSLGCDVKFKSMATIMRGHQRCDSLPEKNGSVSRLQKYTTPVAQRVAT